MRRVASVTLLVLAGVLLPLGIVSSWAWNTLFDSQTFSQRAVAPLDSASVRRELSKRLTEQLVLAGNQQANSFRPAVEIALEGVIDTDTFRSIFRSAVRQAHESILAGRGGGDGLNLGDSFAILTSGLQPTGADPENQQGKEGLDNSLSDVTTEFDDLGIWDLDATIETLAVVFFAGSVAAAIGGILLARDRRRAVRQLGVAVVAGGVAIVVLLVVARWIVGRQIDDAQLSGAMGGALSQVTDDLRQTGLWVAVYGIVIAAAATDSARRYTPAEVWRRVGGWFERRRRTTAGTILIAVLGLLASVLLIQDPGGNFEVLIRVAGLWIGYLALSEVLRLVRTAAARTDRRRSRWPRVAIVAGALIVVLAVVTSAFVLSAGRAATDAEASGEQRCNGDASLCDLTIDQVTFAGSHNSMSSSQYPGFFFAEQVGTIDSQLNAGVRALLIDTHYGVPSNSSVPGANVPLVLTDRVGPAPDTGEGTDAASSERASRLAARTERAADARRDIYLCHNHCELGATRFSSVLEGVASFLDTHPDEVVMLVIQDETTPADTAAAIRAAGLATRAATLRPGEPLPSLRELIDRGRTLLVFSEVDTAGAPPWYHSAFEWFQETPYRFESKDEFNCRPNRGPTSAPLFLLNHWVTSSPPNPATASAANAPAALQNRIQSCIAERGLAPNVVAVDFAERGSVISTVDAINQASLDEERARRRTKKDPVQGGADRTPRAVITTTDVGALPPPAESTALTQLTGGDPLRFCPTLPPALRAVTSWAEAILPSAPGDAGIADLVYGPLLARDLEPYVETAPTELADRAQPILDRAESALDTLRTIGFDDQEIAELADSVARALDAPEQPDGATVSALLARTLGKSVDPARVRQVAVVFTSGQPDPATLLDLGFVPPEVGAASGFQCAPILASI